MDRLDDDARNAKAVHIVFRQQFVRHTQYEIREAVNAGGQINIAALELDLVPKYIGLNFIFINFDHISLTGKERWYHHRT